MESSSNVSNHVLLTENDVVMSPVLAFKSEMKVCIIGGGLGGLALALALQNIGIQAIVYEQDR